MGKLCSLNFGVVFVRIFLLLLLFPTAALKTTIYIPQCNTYILFAILWQVLMQIIIEKKHSSSSSSKKIIMQRKKCKFHILNKIRGWVSWGSGVEMYSTCVAVLMVCRFFFFFFFFLIIVLVVFMQIFIYLPSCTLKNKCYWHHLKALRGKSPPVCGHKFVLLISSYMLSFITTMKVLICCGLDCRAWYTSCSVITSPEKYVCRLTQPFANIL